MPWAEVLWVQLFCYTVSMFQPACGSVALSLRSINCWLYASMFDWGVFGSGMPWAEVMRIQHLCVHECVGFAEIGASINDDMCLWVCEFVGDALQPMCTCFMYSCLLNQATVCCVLLPASSNSRLPPSMRCIQLSLVCGVFSVYLHVVCFLIWLYASLKAHCLCSIRLLVVCCSCCSIRAVLHVHVVNWQVPARAAKPEQLLCVFCSNNRNCLHDCELTALLCCSVFMLLFLYPSRSWPNHNCCVLPCDSLYCFCVQVEVAFFHSSSKQCLTVMIWWIRFSKLGNHSQDQVKAKAKGASKRKGKMCKQSKKKSRSQGQVKGKAARTKQTTSSLNSMGRSWPRRNSMRALTRRGRPWPRRPWPDKAVQAPTWYLVPQKISALSVAGAWKSMSGQGKGDSPGEDNSNVVVQMQRAILFHFWCHWHLFKTCFSFNFRACLSCACFSYMSLAPGQDMFFYHKGVSFFVFLHKHNHTTHHVWQCAFMIKCVCVCHHCVWRRWQVCQPLTNAIVYELPVSGAVQSFVL